MSSAAAGSCARRRLRRKKTANPIKRSASKAPPTITPRIQGSRPPPEVGDGVDVERNAVVTLVAADEVSVDVERKAVVTNADADEVSVVGVIVAMVEGAVVDVGEVVGKVDDATVVGVAVHSEPCCSLEQAQFAGAVVQSCEKDERISARWCDLTRQFGTSELNVEIRTDTSKRNIALTIPSASATVRRRPESSPSNDCCTSACDSSDGKIGAMTAVKHQLT